MATRRTSGGGATSTTSGRCIALALSALGCAAVIAACGGSSSKSTTSAGYTQGVKFASCMRSHGVPNFPDPVAGGGFQFPVSSGFNPFAPAAAAAQHDCRSLLPAGGKGPGEASAQGKARSLALAQCMREHGVTGFPDPVSSPPSNPDRLQHHVRPAGGGHRGPEHDQPADADVQARGDRVRIPGLWLAALGLDPAAVDHQRLPVDRCRARRGEEHDRVGDLVGLEHPPERRRALQGRLDLLRRSPGRLDDPRD